ncbi:hypothetical protein ACT6QH_06910 [Xanthobacter sp. TB0139]|uniref:hypothetical protein n=1 Tax=Xanthobacter sp. TB0139 TaxID=3459178 RepID=UPI004039FC94
MASIAANTVLGEAPREHVGGVVKSFFSALAKQRKATARYGDIAHVGMFGAPLFRHEGERQSAAISQDFKRAEH